MNRNFTKFTFTDSVKNAQEHYGTRRSYARMEQAGDRYILTDQETAFIESIDIFKRGNNRSACFSRDEDHRWGVQKQRYRDPASVDARDRYRVLVF